MHEDTIKSVLLEIIKAYHSYLGNEVWEETILKANNGDCIWIAHLAHYVLLQGFGITTEVKDSPHHTFLVHDGKVYDTLYPNGGEVLDLPFYGVSQSNRRDLVPLSSFRLDPWDKDIYAVVHHVCNLYGVLPLGNYGANLGTPIPICIDYAEDELLLLESMEVDVEYQIKQDFDVEHVYVSDVINKSNNS